MDSLIQVFRMSEVSVTTRVKIIKQLGKAINNQLGGNLTEELVYELVIALDPANEIASDEYYKRFAA